MKKNLFYMLLFLCISFLTMHDVSVQHEHAETDFDEISFVVSDYTLSEFSHEQSASRPTNISVPTFVRTASASRYNSNSSGNGQTCLKAESMTLSWLKSLKYLEYSFHSSGFSDSRRFLLSLCRLTI